MGGITQKEDLTVTQAGKQALVEAVVAQPDNLVGYVADKCPNAGIHSFRAALEIDIRAGTDLPIDAPDAVRLGMDQHGRAGMGGVVEEETRLGRKVEARTSAIRKRSSKERPGKSRASSLRRVLRAPSQASR